MASVPVTLPELGESVVEGTVTAWLVKEGDWVRMDQPVVEVTTDKADTEISAPAAGLVAKILVGRGETAEVGAELARIDTEARAPDAGRTRRGADASRQPARKKARRRGERGRPAWARS